MFQKFFKNRKIKKYVMKLPQDLKANYGFQKYYSKAQVDAAIKRKKIGNNTGVAITDNCYAYAMYCSPEEFKVIHDHAGENCNYESMRDDISSIVFSGAAGFSFSTLLVESSISDFGGVGGLGGGGSSSFGGGDGGGSD